MRSFVSHRRRDAGSEEEAPLLANPRWLRRLLRLPTTPLAPTLFVPLPVGTWPGFYEVNAARLQ